MTRKGVELSDLVSKYYEVGPGIYQPGVIVWIPSLYPNKDRFAVDFRYLSDPTEENLIAPIAPLAQNWIHPPVRTLGLASDEYLFAVKGKMRPAVLLAGGYNRWPTNPTEQLWLCVPLYGVDKPKIAQSFVIDVQALKIPSMFYLPPDALFQKEESIARFPLIQVAHGNALEFMKAGKDNVMLTDEFFGWMKAHLTVYLGGALPNEVQRDLRDYGEIVIDQAKEQGAIP